MKFKEFIFKIRVIYLKQTQQEFAEFLGVNRGTVISWESGKTEPHLFMRILNCLKNADINDINNDIQKLEE